MLSKQLPGFIAMQRQCWIAQRNYEFARKPSQLRDLYLRSAVRIVLFCVKRSGPRASQQRAANSFPVFPGALTRRLTWNNSAGETSPRSSFFFPDSPRSVDWRPSTPSHTKTQAAPLGESWALGEGEMSRAPRLALSHNALRHHALSASLFAHRS